jgi:hypothetical protein
MHRPVPHSKYLSQCHSRIAVMSQKRVALYQYGDINLACTVDRRLAGAVAETEGAWPVFEVQLTC